MLVILGLHLCTPHSNNMEKVTDIIIEQIRNRCIEFLNEEQYSKLADNSKEKVMKDRFNIKSEILILEKKLKDINKIIDKLYEDKCKGLLEDDDFNRIYVKQTETKKDIKERMEQLKEQEQKEGSSVDITKLVKDFVNMKEVTRTMLVSLVDKIEISEQKEITIYYKFNILNMENGNKLKNVG